MALLLRMQQPKFPPKRNPYHHQYRQGDPPSSQVANIRLPFWACLISPLIGKSCWNCIKMEPDRTKGSTNVPFFAQPYLLRAKRARAEKILSEFSIFSKVTPTSRSLLLALKKFGWLFHHHKGLILVKVVLGLFLCTRATRLESRTLERLRDC